MGKEVQLEPKKNAHKEPLDEAPRLKSLKPVDMLQNSGGFAWSYNIEEYEVKKSSETMQFNVQGAIHTQDGVSIELEIEVGVSQTLIEKHLLSQETITNTFKDPLIVQFDEVIPELSSQKFQFDIDSDGAVDSISYLKPGSAYLAYDQNGNGKVDNGNELFGTQSQNGFEDLKAFDDDANGWIDENDAIFEGLQIWQKNDAGEDKLLSLGEVGIGALYLGHVNTPLTRYGDTLNVEGRLTQSGLFINEDGTTGTLHQIDVVT